MGLYSVVYFRWINGTTKQAYDIGVQFRYGSTRLQEYRIGDSLKWDANNVGKPGTKRVVALGYVDETIDKPAPTGIPAEFEVHIHEDRIESVIPNSGQYDFGAAENDFLVLET